MSYHYLEKSIEVNASKKLVDHLKKNLDARFGTIWTSDSLYRETVSKYKKYKKEGVLGIDMETASAYAVAKHRGTNIASCLIVSDIISPDKWNPQFHSEIIEKGVYKIIKNII